MIMQQIFYNQKIGVMNGLDSYLKSQKSTPKIKKFLVIESDSQNQLETKSSEFKLRQDREKNMKCDERKHMSANPNRSKSKTKSLFTHDTSIKFSSIDLTNHKKFVSEHDINTNFTNSGIKSKGAKINMNTSKVSRFNQNSDMFLEKEGFLNDYINKKKSKKSQSNFTLMDIHRVESECSALQKLIDKLVKKEAELSVKKYNLLKCLRAGQADEKSQNESSQNRAKKRQKNIPQNLNNIYKTVELTKKKIR